MMLVMELMEEDLFHAIANDATGSGDSVLWNFRQYTHCSKLKALHLHEIFLEL